MKKITIGIAVICSLLPSLSFAANTATSKNDSSIPCYNGGYTFGLAGYYAKSSTDTHVESMQQSDQLDSSAKKVDTQSNTVTRT